MSSILRCVRPFCFEHLRKGVIWKKQKELQELDNRLANQLVSKQQKMNERLKLSIDSTIKEYNKDKKFHVIFCNTNNDNILYADKAYNITNEILEKINAPK